jgi:hypothetical protein
VRHGAHRTPLQAPYDGPFRVLERRSKSFLLELNGKQDVVSLDRLKPAYGVFTPTISTTPPAPSAVLPTVPATTPAVGSHAAAANAMEPPTPPLATPPTIRTYAEIVAAPNTVPKTTLSGHVMRPPEFFSANSVHGVAVGGGHVAPASSINYKRREDG